MQKRSRLFLDKGFLPVHSQGWASNNFNVVNSQAKLMQWFKKRLKMEKKAEVLLSYVVRKFESEL